MMKAYRFNFDTVRIGFSNCELRVTTDTPTIVYWYAAVIKQSKYKETYKY